MDNIDRKRLIPYRTWERISECKKEKFPVQRRARAWADPFGLSTPLPMPASADALMQTLDTMPYAQRNGSVARLGRDHAAHPQMGALIVALRQHPEPEVPAIEVEEGFTQLLPPQKRNTAKFYAHDLAALFLAASSPAEQRNDIFVEEVRSPSMMLKPLAVKEAVRRGTSDAELLALIKEAVPRVRRQLLSQCVKARRVAVLAAALPFLLGLTVGGSALAAQLLHGCSASFVKQQLPSFLAMSKEIKQELNWKKLAQYHSETLLDSLEAELKASLPLDYAAVWEKWNPNCANRDPKHRGAHALLEKGENALRVWNLYRIYPPQSWLPTLEMSDFGPAKPPVDRVGFSYPALVKDERALFIRRFPDLFIADLIERTHLSSNGRIAEPGDSIIELLALPVSVELYCRYLEHYLALVRRSSNMWSKSAFSAFFCEFRFTETCGHFRSSRVLEVFSRFTAFLKDVKPQKTDDQYEEHFSTWQTWLKTIAGSLRFYANGRANINITQQRELMLKAGLLPDYAQKLPTSIFDNECMDAREWVLMYKMDPHPSKSVRLDKELDLARYHKITAFVHDQVEALLHDEADPFALELWDREVELLKNVVVPEEAFDRFNTILAQTCFSSLATAEGKAAFEKEAGKDNFSRAKTLFTSTLTTAIPIFAKYIKQRELPQKTREVAQALQQKCLDFLFRSGQELESFVAHDEQQVFDAFLSTLDRKGLRADAEKVARFMTPLSEERRLRLWALFAEQDLVWIGQNSFNTLVSMIDLLPPKALQPFLPVLLPAISKNDRDKLLYLQDVSDPAVRKSLEKAADSNNGRDEKGEPLRFARTLLTFPSLEERVFNIHTLMKASLLSDSALQVHRSLKFIKGKVKNETRTNRQTVFSNIFTCEKVKRATRYGAYISSSSEYTSTVKGMELFFPPDITLEQIAVYLELLQDALESPDLDSPGTEDSTLPIEEHPLLKFFRILSRSAFYQGSFHLVHPLVELAYEMQWRIALFRHGEKEAANKFAFDGIDFRVAEPPLFHSLSPKWNGFEYPPIPDVEKLRAIFAWIFEEHDKRISSRVPDWRDKFPVNVINSFSETVTCTWPEIPQLESLFRRVLEHDRATAPRDIEGLVIPSNTSADERPIEVILERFLDFAFRDEPRQGYSSSMPTFYYKQLPALAQEYYHYKIMEMRPTSARDLIEIVCEDTAQLVKSLRVETRCERLIAYLQRVPSAIHHKFAQRLLLRYRQDVLDAYINQNKSFRGCFWEAPIDRTIVTGDKRHPTHTLDYDKDHLSREPKLEAEMLEALERMPAHLRDHPDLFQFEPCFGLHRLLPRQAEALAAQWGRIVLNKDRSSAWRVKAASRWTLMPTVSYADMAAFFTLNEKERIDPATGQKLKGLPLNVAETILRGLLVADEPAAPLNMLLSPKFLSSRYSRTAVYSIRQAVPVLPPSALTSIVSSLLNGKRRYDINVSSQKELLRLLASMPTPENVAIILKEWARTDLHRDVRIVILFIAMRFLSHTVQSNVDAAWGIFKSAAASSNTEILTCVLGALPASAPFGGLPDTLFNNRRLADQLETLNDARLPENAAKRYAEEIMLPLCDAADDDIRTMAHFCLRRFAGYGLAETIATRLSAFLSQLGPDTQLFSAKKSLFALFNRRYAFALDALCDLTCDRDHPVPVRFLQSVAQALCSALAALPVDEQQIRAQLISNADAIFTDFSKPLDRTAQVDLAQNLFARRAEERTLLAPFEALSLFRLKLLHRRARDIRVQDAEPAQVLLPELIAACLEERVAPSAALELFEALEALDGMKETNPFAQILLNLAPPQNVESPFWLAFSYEFTALALGKFPRFVLTQPAAVLAFIDKALAHLEAFSLGFESSACLKSLLNTAFSHALLPFLASKPDPELPRPLTALGSALCAPLAERVLSSPLVPESFRDRFHASLLAGDALKFLPAASLPSYLNRLIQQAAGSFPQSVASFLESITALTASTTIPQATFAGLLTAGSATETPMPSNPDLSCLAALGALALLGHSSAVERGFAGWAAEHLDEFWATVARAYNNPHGMEVFDTSGAKLIPCFENCCKQGLSSDKKTYAPSSLRFAASIIQKFNSHVENLLLDKLFSPLTLPYVFLADTAIHNRGEEDQLLFKGPTQASVLKTLHLFFEADLIITPEAQHSMTIDYFEALDNAAKAQGASLTPELTTALEAFLTISSLGPRPSSSSIGTPHYPTSFSSSTVNRGFLQRLFSLNLRLLKSHPAFFTAKPDVCYGFLQVVCAMAFLNPTQFNTLQADCVQIIREAYIPPKKGSPLDSLDVNALSTLRALVSASFPVPALAQYHTPFAPSKAQARRFFAGVALELLRPLAQRCQHKKRGIWVWRPEHLALLEELCQDADPSVRAEALRLSPNENGRSLYLNTRNEQHIKDVAEDTAEAD